MKDDSFTWVIQQLMTHCLQTQFIAFKKEPSMNKLMKGFKEDDNGVSASGFRVDLSLIDLVEESKLLEELKEIDALPKDQWTQRCNKETSHFKTLTRDNTMILCFTPRKNKLLTVIGFPAEQVPQWDSLAFCGYKFVKERMATDRADVLTLGEGDFVLKEMEKNNVAEAKKMVAAMKKGRTAAVASSSDQESKGNDYPV